MASRPGQTWPGGCRSCRWRARSAGAASVAQVPPTKGIAMRHRSLLISAHRPARARRLGDRRSWRPRPAPSSIPNRRRSAKKSKAASSPSRTGHLNQITEDPTDTEPAFSADGRTIAFVRGGDLYSIRPDGSGQRQLTSGAELDAQPLVSPNGRYVVFERRAAAGAPRDLYTVGVTRRRRARARPLGGRRARSDVLARRLHDRLRPRNIAGNDDAVLGPPGRRRVARA